jgi:hypothetical protein
LTKTHTKKTTLHHCDNNILFVPQNDHWTFEISMAEVLMTNFIVENNFLIATADKCGPLLKNMSPDSQIAKQYQCVKTKTVCILNRVFTY